MQEAQSFPESYPQLPKQEMLENSLLQKHIMELAVMLDVQNLFTDGILDNYWPHGGTKSTVPRCMHVGLSVNAHTTDPVTRS